MPPSSAPRRGRGRRRRRDRLSRRVTDGSTQNSATCGGQAVPASYFSTAALASDHRGRSIGCLHDNERLGVGVVERGMESPPVLWNPESLTSPTEEHRSRDGLAVGTRESCPHTGVQGARVCELLPSPLTVCVSNRCAAFACLSCQSGCGEVASDDSACTVPRTGECVASCDVCEGSEGERPSDASGGERPDVEHQSGGLVKWSARRRRRLGSLESHVGFLLYIFLQQGV